jgi:hypothetical protein
MEQVNGTHHCTLAAGTIWTLNFPALAPLAEEPAPMAAWVA